MGIKLHLLALMSEGTAGMVPSYERPRRIYRNIETGPLRDFKGNGPSILIYSSPNILRLSWNHCLFCNESRMIAKGHSVRNDGPSVRRDKPA